MLFGMAHILSPDNRTVEFVPGSLGTMIAYSLRIPLNDPYPFMKLVLPSTNNHSYKA